MKTYTQKEALQVLGFKNESSLRKEVAKGTIQKIDRNVYSAKDVDALAKKRNAQAKPQPKKEGKPCACKDDYLNRMVYESAELAGKLLKADKAFKEKKLDSIERHLLGEQVKAMKNYAYVLSLRIDYARNKRK